MYFDCGLIVHGTTNYLVSLTRETLKEVKLSNSDSSLLTKTTRVVNKTILSNLTIKPEYPIIAFEVPHRLESYTSSVPISIGLTRAPCKPKLPLPATELTLNICKEGIEEEEQDEKDNKRNTSKSDDDNDESENHSTNHNTINSYDSCGRIFAILSLNPLEQLQVSKILLLLAVFMLNFNLFLLFHKFHSICVWLVVKVFIEETFHERLR